MTCGEWLSFMADGGYTRPEFWLSDGWSVVLSDGWRSRSVTGSTDPDDPEVAAAVHPHGHASG